MRIYKGSNQEITVAVAPCCYVGDMENLVLNFYTTEGTAIEFSGDSITLSGKNATVVFQPAQLDLLEDGVIKYISTFEDEGEEKTYDMTSQYYLKTPASYVSQHFITEENLIDTIENNESINEYIDNKVSGFTTTAETAELSASTISGLSELEGAIEELSGATSSGLSDLEQAVEDLSGATVSGLSDLADSKISKPADGMGHKYNPIFINVSGETEACNISTTSSTRYSALVATDSAGWTHAGRSIVFHQMGNEIALNPKIEKLTTIDGFTAYIITTGTEDNELLDDNRRYLIDSRDYMHIKLISYADYDQLVEDNEVDPKTIYLFSGDTFGTERKIHKYIQNYNLDGFDDARAVDGTIIYKHDEGKEFGEFFFVDDIGRWHALFDDTALWAKIREVEADVNAIPDYEAGSGISISGNVISCTLVLPESGTTSGQVQDMISTAMEAETARTEETYAKITDLSNYSTTADTADAISSALTDYSTTADTQNAISSALTDYSTTADTADAISSALTGYATEQWVKAQGYITGYTGSTSINDAGNNYTPVYVSGGTVIAANLSYTGRRWGVPMFVNPNDGGVEAGAFIDFHNTSGSTKDYDGRIRKRIETAGFSFVYDVAGTETNTLAPNEHYAVDSRNIIHIQKITQSAYDALAVKDNLTLYIIV